MQLIRCMVVMLILLSSVAVGLPLKGGIPATLPTLYVDEHGIIAGDHNDVAFLECFTRLLKQEIHWASYPTARLIQETKESKLDIIFPMGFTQVRRAQLQQSEPVQLIEDYWVYKKALPDITNKRLLVGVKLGSPQESYVQQQGYENIIRHNDYSGLFKMLLAKRVQLLALPDIVYKGIVAQQGQGETQFIPYTRRGYGFYLRPNASPKFMKNVNQGTRACRP